MSLSDAGDAHPDQRECGKHSGGKSGEKNHSEYGCIPHGHCGDRRFSERWSDAGDGRICGKVSVGIFRCYRVQNISQLYGTEYSVCSHHFYTEPWLYTGGIYRGAERGRTGFCAGRKRYGGVPGEAPVQGTGIQRPGIQTSGEQGSQGGKGLS